MDERLKGFTEGLPVFNFKKGTPSRYIDEFWREFWLHRTRSLPVHFPFQMQFEGQLSRAIDSEKLSSSIRPGLDKLLRIECRIYPYGAVSLQLVEDVRFKGGCTSEDIVEFLSQKFQYDSRILTQRQFLHEIRDNLLGQMLERRENFQLLRPEPQYVFINPRVETLPEVKLSWKDLSVLLARSRVPDHIAKCSFDRYSHNYGRDGQLILCGPYSTVIFTPDLENDDNARTCLRNRISYVGELVTIQEIFLEEYVREIDRAKLDIESRRGYPLAQFLSFIRDRISGRLRSQLVSLQVILGFYEALEDRGGRWFRWYLAIADKKREALKAFATGLENLNKANIRLGKDVRDSITDAIKVAKEFTSLLPSKETSPQPPQAEANTSASALDPSAKE